jgi:hypothetical protein
MNEGSSKLGVPKIPLVLLLAAHLLLSNAACAEPLRLLFSSSQDVLNAFRLLGKKEFTISETYRFAPMLEQVHPNPQSGSGLNIRHFLKPRSHPLTRWPTSPQNSKPETTDYQSTAKD